MKTNTQEPVKKGSSLLLACFVFLIFNFTFCSWVKYLGPYKGKVVDQVTGQPIEGAIVFVQTSTRIPNPGGYSSSYAGHEEVFTDQNGEFEIKKLILTFRPISIWGDIDFVILKPGYKNYKWFTGKRLRRGEVGISIWIDNIIKLKKNVTNNDIEEYSNFNCIPMIPCKISANVRLFNYIGDLKRSIKPSPDIVKEYKIISELDATKIQEKNIHYSNYELALWENFGRQYHIYLKKYHPVKNDTIKPAPKGRDDCNYKVLREGTKGRMPGTNCF